jgi:hypothetical protein
MDPTASNQHMTISPTLLPPSDRLTTLTLVNDAYSVHFTSRRVKQTNTSIPSFGADEMNEIVAVSAEIADRVRDLCARTRRSMGFFETADLSPEKLSERKHQATFLTVSLQEVHPRSDGPDELTTSVSIEIRLDR